MKKFADFIISNDISGLNESLKSKVSKNLHEFLESKKRKISKSILEFSHSDIQHNLLSPEYDKDDEEVQHHMKQPVYWKIHSNQESNHRVDSDQGRMLQTVEHLNDLGHKVHVERVKNA